MQSPCFLKHISFWQEAGSPTGQSQKNCDVQQQPRLEEVQTQKSEVADGTRQDHVQTNRIINNLEAKILLVL